MYVHLQNLLARAASAEDYSEDMDRVVRLYEGDIDPARLQSQLEVITAHFQSQQMCEEGTAIKVQVAFVQVKDYVLGLGKGRELLSEIVKILRLILIPMPLVNGHFPFLGE